MITFNALCVGNYYDHPTYGRFEVPASQIGLHTSPQVWVEGPNYGTLI